MVKGHMQDGKFHPHTDYKKGTRKSRDQSAKSTGVKLERKAREKTCDCGRGLTEFGDCERCGFNPEVCMDINPTLGINNCFQINVDELQETLGEERYDDIFDFAREITMEVGYTGMALDHEVAMERLRKEFPTVGSSGLRTILLFAQENN